MPDLTPGEELVERKARLKAETEVGGDLVDLPCPYCHLPRCSRSDYVRCSKCGLNWPVGYDYLKHPQLAWAAKEAAERATRK